MRKREHKVKLHNLMFLYVVTTIIVTVVSFSKYVTTVSTSNIATIATMANNVSVDMELPKEAYPGYEMICPIIITNKENEKVCDVAQEFIVQIEREEMKNIPITFALYKDEFCTEIIEKDENGNYVSDEFTFSAGIEDTKTYYLKITWPEKENEEYLAFEIGYFSINVISTQID